MKEKQREYGKTAERAESVIKSTSGFGKELAHEKIVAIKKELVMTESEILAPLRSALIFTHSLHYSAEAAGREAKISKHCDITVVLPEVCLIS